MAAISGLLHPREGEIRFGDQVVSGLAPRQVLARGISQIPQAHSLFTVTPGIPTGSCARNAAKRAMFHPCSPSGCAQPRK